MFHVYLKEFLGQSCKKIDRGFSLTELLITLMILAIVSSFAVPMIFSITNNSQLRAQTSAFIQLIDLTQSSAGRLRENVTLCPSNDQVSCSGSDWSQGLIVCATNQCGAEVIHVKDKSEFIGVRAVGLPPVIEFNSSGDLIVGGMGSFIFCDNRGPEYAKAIMLVASGRSINATDSDNSGIVEDHTGNDVTCP